MNSARSLSAARRSIGSVADNIMLAVGALRAWADRGEPLGQARVFEILYLGPDRDAPTDLCWSVRVEEAHRSWSATSAECSTLVQAMKLAIDEAKEEGLE